MANQFDNPLLVGDYEVSLDSIDILRGTGDLDWATGAAIASWDGITVDGTPQRVTKLKLANKGLTGTVPGHLAELTGLTEIKLARNNLTGCIPLALEQVPSSDLSTLNLPYW